LPAFLNKACALIPINNIQKNGIQGILYLTSDPKFGVVIPTINPKARQNTRQNNSTLSLNKAIKNPTGPALKRVYKKNNMKIVLSKALKNIMGLEDSQKYGLKKTAFITLGEIFSRPFKLRSTSPNSKKDLPSPRS